MGGGAAGKDAAAQEEDDADTTWFCIFSIFVFFFRTLACLDRISQVAVEC